MQGAAGAGQTTSVFTLGNWDEAPARIPALGDGRVDGLILLAPLLQDDRSAWLPSHTPLVSVHADSPVAGVVNIESDNEAGACAMVRQLLAMGHRRILHVGNDVRGDSLSTRRPELRTHGGGPISEISTRDKGSDSIRV